MSVASVFQHLPFNELQQEQRTHEETSAAKRATSPQRSSMLVLVLWIPIHHNHFSKRLVMTAFILGRGALPTTRKMALGHLLWILKLSPVDGSSDVTVTRRDQRHGSIL